MRVFKCCVRCMMHMSLCICALFPRIETRTRLVLVIHRYEDRKPTNTGRLGAECLVNSDVVVRGHEGQPSAPLRLPPGTLAGVAGRSRLLTKPAASTPEYSMTNAPQTDVCLGDGRP